MNMDLEAINLISVNITQCFPSSQRKQSTVQGTQSSSIAPLRGSGITTRVQHRISKRTIEILRDTINMCNMNMCSKRNMCHPCGISPPTTTTITTTALIEILPSHLHSQITLPNHSVDRTSPDTATRKSESVTHSNEQNTKITQTVNRLR